MDEDEIVASMADDEMDRLIGLVIKLRGALQHIYAMRGEDDFIAGVCDPLIEMTRDF